MKRKTQPTQQAPALPFPPAGAPIVADGMVSAALQLGGVLRHWQECNFFTADIAKQYGDGELANAKEGKR